MKSKAIIGLTQLDTHLEQVQDAEITSEMWKMLHDTYEKHILLNRLTARRPSYTAKMKESEKSMKFGSRIRPLATSLKSMNVVIDDNEMEMTFQSTRVASSDAGNNRTSLPKFILLAEESLS